MTDICVIGGGASGMAAAVAAHMTNPAISICIIEKNDALGRKLLATGNGRCNFTNALCENFNEVLKFFDLLGIKSRTEEQGRVYPYSGQAKDVLKAFSGYLDANNIEIVTGFSVEKLLFDLEDGIHIEGGKKEISAKRVLLSTGGKAGPQFGCVGDGYKMAREAGHHVTAVIPALAPVACEGDFETLAGVRVKASVSLLRNGGVLQVEDGEVQFTDYGLSGICVFNLSRFIRLSGFSFKDYEIKLDLLPDRSMKDAVSELEARIHNVHIARKNLLLSIVPDRLAAYIWNKAPESGAKETDGGADNLAGLLKGLKFTVSNVKGWKFAQCSSGGVPTEEINLDTMESKIKKGLYFAGELIDYDGPCGGYNLNNAWETGIKAGKAMALNVQNS